MAGTNRQISLACDAMHAALQLAPECASEVPRRGMASRPRRDIASTLVPR